MFVFYCINPVKVIVPWPELVSIKKNLDSRQNGSLTEGSTNQKVKKKLFPSLFLDLNTYIQGPSWQSGYFKMALIGRNVQARFCLKVVLES